MAGILFAWRAIGGNQPSSYATGPGERRELTLDDGTAVVLAPRSTLTVARGYGREARSLRLDGEAWFAVSHDAARPFTVIAGHHVVRDIGTVFTVRSRHPDSVAVIVVEGRVAVGREERPGETMLAAGDVAEFGTADPTVRHDQPVVAMSGWRDGRLEFTTEPADRVARRLSEWFGVTIVIADSGLAQRPVSATFARGSLDDALDVLSLLLGTTVHRDSARIVLR